MKIVIWGTDEIGSKALEICRLLKIEVLAFLDNDNMKQGKYFKDTDIWIYNPNEFKNIIAYENTPILLAENDKAIQIMAYSMSRNVIEFNVLKNAWIRLGKKDYQRVQLANENIENCKLIDTRETMLKRFPSGMVMAEVGSFKGDFAQKILDICNPSKLYLIDAWEGERWEQYYQEVKDRFKNEIDAGKVEIMKGYSTRELAKFLDNELDWVYIDTVHDYKTTHDELEISHLKVNKNGFICGHDYTNYNIVSRVEYGVWAAVNEFIMKYNYELKYMTMESYGCKSYCLQLH